MSTAGDPKMSENESNMPLTHIYELLKKEVENPALQQIEPDTYQQVAAALGNLKGQGFEGVEAKVRDKTVELISDSARLLFELRQRKISAEAGISHSGDGADGSGDREPLDYSRLTEEEKYVLD